MAGNCDITPQIKGKDGKWTDSILFSDLMGITGNRKKAVEIYTRVHSPEFTGWFGNWMEESLGKTVDKNGEPIVTRDGFINSKGELMSIGENKIDSDDLLPTATEPLIKQESSKIRVMRSVVSKLQDQLKKAKSSKNTKLINSLGKRIKRLRDRIEDLDKKKFEFKEITTFDEIIEEGKKQLSEIENFLSEDVSQEMANNFTFDDLFYMDKVVNLWRRAGDFSTSPEKHIFLDEDEFNTPEIRKQFSSLGTDADVYAGKIYQIKEMKLVEFVKKYAGEKLTKEEIFEIQKDAMGISTQALNLGRMDHKILQAIHAAVETANIKAEREANIKWKEIDELGGRAYKKLKRLFPNLSNPYEAFKQKWEDGKETGNLIFRYTQEFFDTLDNLKDKAFYQRDKKGNKTYNKKAIEKYYEFKKQNTITFDIRKLIPDSQWEGNEIPSEFIYSRKTYDSTMEENHKRDLIAHLGQRGFDHYMERLQGKIEAFQVSRQAAYEDIMSNENWSENERKAQFEEWLRENSPYWMLDMEESPAMRQKPGGGYYSPIGYKYTYEVPRRFTDKGETAWYDKGFEKIEKDDDLREFYEYILDTLDEMKQVYPDDKQKLLGVNVLPFIKKSVTDQFSDGGLKVGILPFWNKLMEATRTDGLSESDTREKDILTGEAEESIRATLIKDNRKKIEAIVNTRKIKFNQDNKRKPTASEIKEFRREALDEIAKTQSWDLTKIMKAYTMASLSFKHKSFIEPQIKVADEIFNNQREAKTNKAGEILKNPDGTIDSQEGLNHLKAMEKFYLQSSFYGDGSAAKDVELQGTKKMYTTEEKKKKKELEELLEKEKNREVKGKKEEEQKQQNITILENQLKELGGVFTGSNVGDIALKYVQLKGMGWNVVAAFANIGFGTISNLIQASDGRDYSQKHLMKAYKMTLDSMASNATFDLARTSRAKKIRNLMDRFNVLQDASEELYKQGIESSYTKNLKRFGFYAPQKRSEYVNQAPIMIAIMLNTKAYTAEGKEVNMWEAYEENGNLKEGYSVEKKGGNAENEIHIQRKIKKVIEMNHGDYANPLMAKKKWWGRALTQFRTWMLEGFANRFENRGGEKMDTTLGYERKGRYITGFGFISYAKGTGMSGPEQTLFTLQQLARKLMFKSTKFDEKGFSEVDAANMRKNLTELVIYIALASTMMLIKGMMEDDEEKDKYMWNFLINLGTRLETDILFYSNPVEFEKLTKSAIPLTVIISDGYKFFDAVGRQFGDNPNMQSGPYKNWNALIKATGQGIPLTSQGLKIYNTGAQIFDK